VFFSFITIDPLLTPICFHLYVFTQKKQEHCRANPEFGLCITIDGMSNNTNVLPYWGNNTTQAHTWTYAVEGSQIEGIGKYFYGSGEAVKGGANLICTALLLQLDVSILWYKHKKLKFPPNLFTCVDGGETGITFYSLMEFLVYNGTFNMVNSSRLPCGHTHCHIDAIFGVTKRCLCQRFLTSPQQYMAEYTAAVRGKFDESSWQSNVHFSHLPATWDLDSFFEGQDVRITNWKTLDDTQLNWVFQSMPPTTAGETPPPVKVSYSKFAYDSTTDGNRTAILVGDFSGLAEFSGAASLGKRNTQLQRLAHAKNAKRKRGGEGGGEVVDKEAEDYDSDCSEDSAFFGNTNSRTRNAIASAKEDSNKKNELFQRFWAIADEGGHPPSKVKSIYRAFFVNHLMELGANFINVEPSKVLKIANFSDKVTHANSFWNARDKIGTKDRPLWDEFGKYVPPRPARTSSSSAQTSFSKRELRAWWDTIKNDPNNIVARTPSVLENRKRIHRPPFVIEEAERETQELPTFFQLPTVKIGNNSQLTDYVREVSAALISDSSKAQQTLLDLKAKHDRERRALEKKNQEKEKLVKELRARVQEADRNADSRHADKDDALKQRVKELEKELKEMLARTNLENRNYQKQVNELSRDKGNLQNALRSTEQALQEALEKAQAGNGDAAIQPASVRKRKAACGGGGAGGGGSDVCEEHSTLQSTKQSTAVLSYPGMRHHSPKDGEELVASDDKEVGVLVDGKFIGRGKIIASVRRGIYKVRFESHVDRLYEDEVQFRNILYLVKNE